MPRENFYYVQFVGGPFDGHVQPVRLPPASLARRVVLPVSEEIFQRLGGGPPAPHTPVTSEALYQLDETSCEPRYRYLKSIAPIASHS